MVDGDVDYDLSDFNGGTRWSEMWLPIFFSLEVVVMVVSFGLNLCLLRGVAKNNQQKETPVYLFILWLFFTKLVEDAVIVGQFIKYEAPEYNHTTAMCQFETFVVLGNRQGFYFYAPLNIISTFKPNGNEHLPTRMDIVVFEFSQEPLVSCLIEITIVFCIAQLECKIKSDFAKVLSLLVGRTFFSTHTLSKKAWLEAFSRLFL